MNVPWKKFRTQLGDWMDRKNVSQQWLADKTGISRSTVTLLCGDSDYIPHNATRSKVIKALRQVDPNVSASDFW